MGKVISVVVDDRESDAGVLRALAAMEGVHVVKSRLPLGDYLVDDKLLFERKTLHDLVASIMDGRLFRQCLRLAASKRRGIVILEGTSAAAAARGMSREAIQGALISISVIMGIPLLRSRNAEESARLMIYTARRVNATVSGAIARNGVRPKGKRRSQFEILQALPGVGPVRAKRLLENFGTVEGVMNAEAGELAQLSGMGLVTAKAIRWVLNEPENSYRVNSGFVA